MTHIVLTVFVCIADQKQHIASTNSRQVRHSMSCYAYICSDIITHLNMTQKLKHHSQYIPLDTRLFLYISLIDEYDQFTHILQVCSLATETIAWLWCISVRYERPSYLDNENAYTGVEASLYRGESLLLSLRLRKITVNIIFYYQNLRHDHTLALVYTKISPRSHTHTHTHTHTYIYILF